MWSRCWLRILSIFRSSSTTTVLDDHANTRYKLRNLEKRQSIVDSLQHLTASLLDEPFSMSAFVNIIRRAHLDRWPPFSPILAAPNRFTLGDLCHHILTSNLLKPVRAAHINKEYALISTTPVSNDTRELRQLLHSFAQLHYYVLFPLNM